MALVSGGLAVAAISGKANAARDKLAQQKVTSQANLSADVVPSSTPSATAGPLIGDPAQAPAGGPGAGPSASPAAALPPAAPAPKPPAPKPKPKPKPKPPVPPPANNSVGEQLLFYINTKRAAKGLYAYRMSPGLVKAANLHSQRMATEHRLSHLFSGEQPIGKRFIGVPWRGAAENAGQENASNTTASIVAAVKRSTDSMLGEGPGGGHYDNLMSNESKLIGIGVVRTSDGMVWLTQDFVTPP